MTTRRGCPGYPAVGEAEEEGECGRWGGSGNRQGKGMAAGGGNKLLPSARRKGHRGGWNAKIGRVEEARCPRCGEEEQTPDHIVFRCRKVRRVEDERGRREWAKEVGMRWDGWDALASKQ